MRPGHRLHVYSVAEVLGAGGFGITYRAEEEFTHRQVAIKEFLPNAFAFRAHDGVGVRPVSEGAGTDFAWGLERFRLEAKTLYSLRHPNIVPVLQYFEANGTGYLVMEYQAGATLGALLKRDNVLDPAELDEILEPLLDGLAAIHAKGFLHRDVKPDNIFIRTDGAPLLLDFGAARQAIGARSQSLTTIISEGYAPFEQYESSGNQGPWTDLYAFGATLYRCMTGLKSVPAPSRVMAQMQGARDPLVPVPAEASERYGAKLVGAVEAAMRVNASARPQTIEAFRALARSGADAESPAAAETLIAAEPAGTIALPNLVPPPRPPVPPPPVRSTPLESPARQRPRKNVPVPPAEPPAKTPVADAPKAADVSEADRYKRGRLRFVVAWMCLAASLFIFGAWMVSHEAPRNDGFTFIIVLVPAALVVAALIFAARGSIVAYCGLVLLQFAYLAFVIFVFVMFVERNFSPVYWYPLSIYSAVAWTFFPFLGRSVRAYVRGRRARRAARAAAAVTPPRAS